MLSALLENVLLTQLPFLATAIIFPLLLSNFSNKEPISAASIFSAVPSNEASVLITLQKKKKKRISHGYYPVITVPYYVS